MAHALVKELKKNFSLPIEVHSHFTSGLADAAYWAAIEAGADVIDTATSALAYGTSQPAAEPFVMALKDSKEFSVNLDMNKINHVNEHFIKVRSNHKTDDVSMTTIDSRIFSAQVPGGMLSNLVSQLKAQNSLDKYDDVMKEIPQVREDLGFPPLVTPTSQIVGVQAVLNVLNGERYKMVTKETKNYVKGMYGKSPAPISDEIVKKILGNEKPINVRPADLLDPALEKAKKEIGDLAQNDEDLLSYVLFPQIAKPFLEKKYVAKVKVDFKMVDEYASEFLNPIYPV
jgi:oxaloacetate decarboxylase alpha subunit